MIKIQLVLW